LTKTAAALAFLARKHRGSISVYAALQKHYTGAPRVSARLPKTPRRYLADKRRCGSHRRRFAITAATTAGATAYATLPYAFGCYLTRHQTQRHTRRRAASRDSAGQHGLAAAASCLSSSAWLRQSHAGDIVYRSCCSGGAAERW